MVGVKEEDVITEINGGNLNGEKDSDVNNSAAKRKDKIIDGKVLRRADGKKKKKKKRKPQTKLEAPSTPLTEIHSSSDNSTAKQEISAEDVKPENVEIEYVPEQIYQDDPSVSEFAGVFEAFKFKESDDQLDKKHLTASAPVIEENIAFQDDEDEEPKVSKKQLRKLNRLTVAQLKQVVDRPDVVEMHDVNSADPKTLVVLKSMRNTVPVPRHWCNKRKYLQGKRGIEKPPFELPDFIRMTGITEMREALHEKEEAQGLKGKMREKVRPKMGKMELDYQKLHDAFFRWQTKPKMSIHGDIYYESKELETAQPDRKPGDLSKELKEALGMPTDPNAKPVPPPWLLHMQRFGPPPSYPNLKIPGLNAPIPPGASYGYEPGNWGKPPVDENGNPLYGDAFGVDTQAVNEAAWEAGVDKTLWGTMESDASESESEDDEESSEDEGGDTTDGFKTPSGILSEAPSGISSIGVSTPESLDVRKKNIEDAMDQTEQQALYKVIPERSAAVNKELMGSAHLYDFTAAQPGSAMDGPSAQPSTSGVEISIDNPEDLHRLDKTSLDAAYVSAAQARASQHEDFSDMVAHHEATSKAKRKKQQDRKEDKTKKFKF
eukprot:gene3582-31_t